MKYTPFKSLPLLLLSLSLLLGAFANVSVLNYAPGRTWYRAAAVGVPCTSKNVTQRKKYTFPRIFAILAYPRVSLRASASLDCRGNV